MMKNVLIFCLLMPFISSAQENKQKRPSWSQGLPERQSALKPTDTMLSKPKTTDAVIDTPDANTFDEPATPTLDVGLVTEPIVVPQPSIELVTEPAKPAVTSRREAREQYYSNNDAEAESTEPSPLVADYSWKVLKTTPIEVPEQFSDNESLKLKIQINPRGRVTRVTVAEADVPALLLQQAEKSIMQWKFEPPRKIGIKQNISRTFTIDIQTEA